MATAKLCSGGTLDTLKPEEGNDSIDTFIRQAIGKEPLISYTRTADTSIQWIQFLHALDQPDNPGWPLLTPMKFPMQKCEKCPREFCSPINYRRHIRVHRRSLNVNKDTKNNRDLLASFWDKISVEQAKKVVSFNDVMLKGISGSSFVDALVSAVNNPGIWSLPPPCVKAASALLDIIHFNPSGSPPFASHELFSILDDASEGTFLCGGTADSVQKYVFDGETSETCLEMKNVVACNSFLFEQQLVKVWMADKDAEAYRCQLLLVEEEEAAQKRQAERLEKKRLKKLRKEQKLKEQLHENVVEVAASAEVSDSNSNPPEILTTPDSSLEPTLPQSQTNEPHEDIEANLDILNIKLEDDSQTNKRQMVGPSGNRYSATNRWNVPFKAQRGGRFRFNSRPLKPEPTTHKPALSKDRSLQNGTKIWTKKLKEIPKPLPPSQGETDHQEEDNDRVVLIGSISVTLKKAATSRQDIITCPSKVVYKKNALENPTKANHVQFGNVGSKHWRPVNNGETKSDVQNLDRVKGDNTLSETVPDKIQLTETSEVQSKSVDGFGNQKGFSSAAAREFLAQRWNEAIASDHVRLVLSEPEPGESSDVVNCEPLTASSNAPDPPENQTEKIVQVKVSKKPGKGVKIKYIPKQKTAA